ncbi:MAG TPA: hypothetical protein VJ828_16310 [Lacipirellulaceae bacterium]|nr:hypothetical protein [Lacipirellulaceae bacterium]
MCQQLFKRKVVMPTNFELIKGYIQNTPLKPMAAKYNPPGGTPGGNGVRWLWPHVLGTSPIPGSMSEEEVVLCNQYHPPAFAGWKCLKVLHLTDIQDVPGTPPSPDDDLTAVELQRQSCVLTIVASR